MKKEIRKLTAVSLDEPTILIIWTLCDYRHNFFWDAIKDFIIGKNFRLLISFLEQRFV